jgi:hypothetical protein
MPETRTGACLCGAIQFTVTGPVEPPMACHCRECQRQTGNYWVAITAPRDRVEITGPVAWISISRRARRGFCPRCGGFLFWEPVDGASIDIGIGNLDDPRGLNLAAHLWCDEAPLPVPPDGTPHYPRGRPKIVS